MKHLFLLCALFFLLCATARADISCSFQLSNDASFGSVDSFTLANTQQTVKSGSGFSCSGSALSLLSTNTINARILSSDHPSGTTPQMMSTTGTDVVPYNICSDTNCSEIYNIGYTKTWSITSLIGLLGLFNASDGSLPLYLKIPAGLNVPAGTYTDTISIHWDYRICVSGIITCNYATGQQTVTLNVKLIVTNFCYIDNAPDVAFTPASIPSSFTTLSNKLSVRCTKNATYTVNLTSANALAGGWRQLIASINQVNYGLQYQFYQPSGSAWTPTNNLSVSGTGASQDVNYTVQINPNQTSKPAGVYTDTVTVTVTY
ncbi:spore coat protein U domain-containing protein [Klebsiella aerogenes]|uniref:spore coat protein U domain-containing protein n=1 Tax=Klebsiella aerogenes TaxID=548 RepID=UPI00063CF534|nr:spore coat protein U domain-containing protein [Klebsiella aerogenes]KLF68658.1 spore coat protein U [Klebsiella aerogenes]